MSRFLLQWRSGSVQGWDYYASMHWISFLSLSCSSMSSVPSFKIVLRNSRMRLQKIEIHQSTLSMALQSNPISERQSEFRFSLITQGSRMYSRYQNYLCCATQGLMVRIFGRENILIALCVSRSMYHRIR